MIVSSSQLAIQLSAASGNAYPYEITVYNANFNGFRSSFTDYNASEIALVQNTQQGMGSTHGTFLNNSENQCANGSSAYQCGQGSAAVYYNINYQALLGNLFNGVGAPNNGNGIETVRVSACRLCVISNNEFENANNVGAVLKLHSGNPNSQPTWVGQYTEMVELSDNLFTGTSGAQLVEIAPQNAQTDERLRNIVVERNLFSGTQGGDKEILVSATNASLRDNVFNGSLATTSYGAQVAKRGIEPVA